MYGVFGCIWVKSHDVLLLRNTDSFQQVEDYVRGCSTFTKYWQPSLRWRLCQSCSTSTIYWKPSTSWILCQRLFYFYEILTTFNKLKIMSEDVLLLRNTDNLQQVEDYDIVRKNLLCCWNSWTNKDIGAIKSLIFHKTFQNNRNNIIVWCIWVYLGKKSRRSTSTKYWQLSTSWRLCQRLFYFYEILTAFAKVKIMSELFYFYDLLKAFNKLNIMSKVVLLLRNTDNLQQVEDHVRGCSTSTKYWQPSTSWRLWYCS